MILADSSAEILGALGAFSGFVFMLDVDGRFEMEGLLEEVEDFGRGGGDRDPFLEPLLLSLLLQLLLVLLFERLLVPLLYLPLLGLQLLLLDLLLILLLLLVVPLLLLSITCLLASFHY